jgi:hypothetical protein
MDTRAGAGTDVDQLVGTHLATSALHRHPARRFLIWGNLFEAWLVGEAFIDPKRTARMEAAA